MAKIIKFKKGGRKQPMSIEEYIDGLNTVEFLVEELRPDRLEAVREILYDMKFAAYFNHKFREETENQLLELIDDLYARTREGEE